MVDRRSARAFGAVLRRHRRAAGFTQEVLAERAGLSWHTISALECGVRHPGLKTLLLLGVGFEKQPGFLVDETAALFAGPDGTSPLPVGRSTS